jgi:hypothetical protein
MGPVPRGSGHPRPERGSGLLATVFGIGITLVMLMMAANLLVGLWSRSVVDSAAWDAARRIATAPDGSAGSAIATACDRVGRGCPSGEVRMSAVVEGDWVVVRVSAPGKELLPSGPSVGAVDRDVRVRLERPLAERRAAAGGPP